MTKTKFKHVELFVTQEEVKREYESIRFIDPDKMDEFLRLQWK